MTHTIPVGCTEAGCDGVVRLAKSVYEDGGDALVGLPCPRGHRFDHEKFLCPRCGAEASPAEWSPLNVWSGSGQAPSWEPVFHPATCTSPECDWEGPK